MNVLPIAHVIQWGAQLAIDRGATVIYNASTMAIMEEHKRRKILES